MIEAIVFDLDGTLVQTELLKALSYAKAAIELCPYGLSQEAVVEAFKEVVGLSRREVATALVDKFDLADQAARRMDEFGVTTPWQAFIHIRLKYYEAMLSDADMIRQHRWPHNLAVLDLAKRAGCKTALATMSRRQQTNRLLEILELGSVFDFIATSEDVVCPKPDPEIYTLVASQLGIAPGQCLVLEDSSAGVRSALAAGMPVVAVATPFTRQGLSQVAGLASEWIVTDHRLVTQVVQRRMSSG